MNNSEYIDLTNSFTLADHCALANIIIDLDTDDSIIEDNVTTDYTSVSDISNSTQSPRDSLNDTETIFKEEKCAKQNKNKKIKKPSPKKSTNEENKFGCCPICWDELGKNPLVSTKCGHVYCHKCLERSLGLEKRCPTCRTMLKGKNSYHALYLPF